MPLPIFPALPNAWSSEWIDVAAGGGAGGDFGDYPVVIQPWLALIEKAIPLGCDDTAGKWATEWPPGVARHHRNQIESFDPATGILTVASTAGDGTGGYGGDWICSGTKRWVNYLSSDCPGAVGGSPVDGLTSASVPAIYDAVIVIDPLKLLWIKGRIIDNGALTLTIRMSDVRRWALNFDLTALADLWFVIQKAGGAAEGGDGTPMPFWMERIPQRPNDQEYVVGSAGAGTTATTILDPARKDLTDGACDGLDCAYLAVDGMWSRAAIVNTTALGEGGTEIELDGTAEDAAEGSDYWVIQSGGYFEPRQRVRLQRDPTRNLIMRINGAAADGSSAAPDDPYTYYTGYFRPFAARDPYGAIGSVYIASTTISRLEYDVDTNSCLPEIHFDGLDNLDFYTPQDARCDEQDRYWMPWGHKCWRALMRDIEDVFSGEYIAPIDYFNKAAIPQMNGAIGFRFNGINDYTTTIAAVGSTTTLTAAAPYDAENYPLWVYYVIEEPDGLVRAGGRVLLTDSTTLALAGLPIGLVGKSITISPGWTWFEPSELLHPFPKTVWIPDTNPSDECGQEIVDPPANETSDGAVMPTYYPTTGRWFRREASTTLASYDDAGHRIETTIAPAMGDLVRVIGDNTADAITPLDVLDDATDMPVCPALDPVTTYYARFHVGKDEPLATRHPMKSGTTASGTAYSFTAAGLGIGGDNDWWRSVQHSETGVLDGASDASHFQDTTKTNNWWVRTDGDGRWIAFVLTVLDGPGGNIVEKMPITAYDPTTTTGDLWKPMASGTTLGADYRIDEPGYELNQWEARPVKLTKPDGSASYDCKILYSDNDTAWIQLEAGGDLPEPIGADWAWQIIEPEWGDTMLYNGTKLVRPTGIDPRDPLAREYPKNMKLILPTVRKRYGRIRLGGYMLAESFGELKNFIDSMWWEKASAIGYGAGGAINRKGTGTSRAAGCDPGGNVVTCANDKAASDAYWADTTPCSGGGGMEPACFVLFADFFNDEAATPHGEARVGACEDMAGVFVEYVWNDVVISAPVCRSRTMEAWVYCGTRGDLAESGVVAGGCASFYLFDTANAPSGADWHRWGMTDAPQTGVAPSYSFHVGDPAFPHPTWPACLANMCAGNSREYSWEALAVVGIIKWSFNFHG